MAAIEQRFQVSYLFKFLMGIALVCIGSGCSTTAKINTLRPEPQVDKTVVFENTPSQCNLPIEIPLSELAEQLNSRFNGLVYEDLDNSEDKLKLKVWVTSPIQLIEDQGQLRTLCALKIWGEYTYGSDLLGLHDRREFQLNGVFSLRSDVQLDQWVLKTQSRIEKVDWVESPSITIAGKSLPVTLLVNPALALFKDKWARMLDEQLAKTCQFKPQVTQVLSKISQPILAQPDYKLWFQLVPIRIQASPLSLSNQTLKLNLALQSRMHTRLGDKPDYVFQPASLQWGEGAMPADGFQLSLAAVATYEQASQWITQKFQGQTFGDKRKVTVQKVELWPKAGKMIIALTMTGSLEGTLYLTGVPMYQADTQEIYMDQMDYVLDTKGVLTRTANWLMQGYILRKMQENCRFSIKNLLNEGKQKAQQYLMGPAPMKGVQLKGTLDQLNFDRVQLTPNAIVAFITAQGQLKVTLKGLEIPQK